MQKIKKIKIEHYKLVFIHKLMVLISLFLGFKLFLKIIRLVNESNTLTLI